MFKNLSGYVLAAVTAVTTSMLATSSIAQDAQKDATAPEKAVGSGWSAQVSPDGTTGIALDEQQASAVRKVSDYFNDLKSLEGLFIQTGADKKVMRGKFKMQQPGRFRFDYNRPSRQIIISDGEYLAIQDLDLANEDRVALDQTPFRILLRKDVDLLRDALIMEVQESDDKILLSLRDKSPDAPGLIKLVLAKTPEMTLKEWVTTDAQGLDTRVQIGKLKRDTEIAAEAFVIKSISRPFPGMRPE
ncbi:MAG: outer membrane lipoprotein carrier protein LolA [Pseudomonadota bacterium]